MKKNKRIFGNLTKRPDGSKLKHKKKYIEIESDEYEDEEYYEDEYYDEEEYYEDEYLDEEDEYNEDEYYDEEEFEDEYSADVYEEEYYDDHSLDEVEYSDDESEEYVDEEYSDGEYYEEEVYEDYSEYDNSEEYSEEEYDDEEYYEEEEVEPRGRKNVKFSFKEWVLDSLYNIDFMDVVLIFTTTLLVIFGAMTVSAVATSNNVSDAIENFIPIGNSLVDVGIVGETGIANIVEAASKGVYAKADNSEAAEAPNESTEVQQEETPKAKINVNFESVEKDLKIRFKNSLTGELITGTAFEVVITNQASGNSLSLVDEDRDGVIYKSGIKAGKFNALISSTDKYKFPTKPQEITIKDKVQYLVINVEDEVKQENEIEVAKEDTEIKVAATENVENPAKILTDTVEFVNPSKTANKPTYTKIDKDKIAEPSLKASALSGSVKFDDFTFSLNKTEVTLKVGESETLSTGLEDSKTDGQIIKYVTVWEAVPSSVATVENGKVTAVAEGTAEIICNVTKSTTSTVEKTKTVRDPKNVKEISTDEYDKLSDEEKKHCEAKYEIKVKEKEPDADDESGDTDEEGEEGSSEEKSPIDKIKDKVEESTEKVLVGYYYIPETTEKYEAIDEKIENATKKCTVKVKGPDPVTISSATFELSTKQVNLAVGASQTVTPTKIVYNMSDGSTKTITSDFPKIVWAPSDISIATVDDKGVIKAVKTGTTTIKATLYDVKKTDGGSISETINVTVGDALSVTIDKTSEQTLKVGDTMQITPSVKNYVKDVGVTWSTSDEKIAKVSIGGLVTAVAPGTATITCTTIEKSTANDKTVSASVTVKVVATAASDKTSKLKDKSGNQVYVKDSNGNYVEAVFADYYTAKEFFLKDPETYTYTGWQTINGKTYYYDKNGKVVTGTQVIQNVSYDFQSDGSLKSSAGTGVRGIDISKWNGSVDWNAVKNSGIDFVIIRCGYRGSSSGALIEDVNFKKNMQGATAAGLKVGVYFFSQAIDEVEAVKEASFAISLAQSYKLTYPIFIDTEKSGGRADSLSTAARTSIVNAFCQTVENAGYKAGIYASQTWYEQKLTTSSLQKYKIWLARYADTVSYSGKYDMWQYTAKGTVNGVSGKVDMNYSYLGY